MDHERDRRIGLRVEQYRITLDLDSLALVGKEGRCLGVDQRLERGRAPMIVGNLVVRASERVDAAIDHRHEFLERGAFGRLGLADQAADQRQDVAHAVIEFGDQ